MFEDQWMVKDIPSDSELSEKLMNLKKMFFEELSGHKFEMSRLHWLHRWLTTQIPDNSRLTSTSTESPLTESSDEIHKDREMKRMIFLTKIWNKSYFHPFATIEESFEIVNRNRNDHVSYCISLSSTIPGHIRLTYYHVSREDIFYYRMDLEKYISDENIEEIDYDLEKLEETILKYLQTKTKNVRIIRKVEYNVTDENRGKIEYH
jgi:hypothetical protein